jgi:hypothetical protein
MLTFRNKSPDHNECEDVHSSLETRDLELGAKNISHTKRCSRRNRKHQSDQTWPATKGKSEKGPKTRKNKWPQPKPCLVLVEQEGTPGGFGLIVRTGNQSIALKR